MADHPNVELLRKGYAAFGAGDMQTVDALLSDDIVWHSPGNNPLAGDYKGKDQVFGLFAKLVELTEGTFRQEIHDLLANDEHAVALCTLSASRGSKSVEFPVANVSHIRDGRVTEFWTATTDPQASIDFWL